MFLLAVLLSCRDIKLENLFISSSGHLQLGDFGLAISTQVSTSSGWLFAAACDWLRRLLALLFLCCTVQPLLFSALVCAG
jgi:serine/threonine protein kinase